MKSIQIFTDSVKSEHEQSPTSSFYSALQIPIAHLILLLKNLIVLLPSFEQE